MSGDARYPIGRFRAPPSVSDDDLRRWIDEVRSLPDELRRATDGLDRDRLDTPYRDAGWSTRQIVHHLADSHMNSVIRFRLALTEDEPTIKPYDQDAWANLVDGNLALYAWHGRHHTAQIARLLEREAW